jgi:DNA-binding NarL/FixJ family response regulator
MKILLVDDDLTFRVQLKRILENKSNFVIIEAEDGVSGLEFHQREKPDLIFLDYEMPNMNARQFLEKLRVNDKAVPVVIITSHSNIEIVKNLIPFGIKDYIIKADLNTKLADRLEQILSEQKSSKAINVLLIEDDLRYRTMMKRLLEKEFPVRVTEADDGQKGIDTIKGGDFDIVFLDFVLPALNGGQFLQKLREFNKSVPVVVITAYSDKKVIDDLLPYGIIDYVIKADMVTKLTERIRSIFDKCNLRSRK